VTLGPTYSGFDDVGRTLPKGWPRRLNDALLTGLVEDAVLVDDPSPRLGLILDPGDDYLVALAQKVDAQYIVSGDAHLTQLTDPRPPVLTPREFLEGRT
jgi:predicted nucleic acid-binding protein